jgi:hypothetical protein
MTTLEWVLQAALVLALAATLPMAARLERALSALKRDQAALADSARGFATATRDADAAIARLRAASDGAGRALAEQIKAAAALREDLRFLSERAEVLANRLDSGVRSVRPVPAEPGAPPIAPSIAPSIAPVPRARAEADLLRALRGGRAS